MPIEVGRSVEVEDSGSTSAPTGSGWPEAELLPHEREWPQVGLPHPIVRDLAVFPKSHLSGQHTPVSTTVGVR
jgi:hypothetical protein